MAGKTRKYEGILREPMPINETEEDVIPRIEALILLFNVNQEQSKLKQYQCVLKNLMQQANEKIQKENEKNEGKKLPIPKLKNYDDICRFVEFHREATTNTNKIMVEDLKIYKKYPPKTETKLFEMGYVISLLANKLEIPAFMPQNVFALMFKKVKDMERFLMYREILYNKKHLNLTNNAAIKKYIEDKHIYYKGDIEDKVASLYSSFKDAKAKSPRVRWFYSKNTLKAAFIYKQLTGEIPINAKFEESFNDKNLKQIAEYAIMATRNKKSYEEFVKYARYGEEKQIGNEKIIEKIKGHEGYTKIFDIVIAYCYNSFSRL